MAQLSGLFRIGGDAELRFTQSGDPVASLSLAYNYGRKGSDGKTPSQWINASLWGKRAEATAPYLLKGGQIYAEIGDVHIETYAKKDGSEGVKLVGRIAEFEFASGKGTHEMNVPEQRERSTQAPTLPMGDFDETIPF